MNQNGCAYSCVRLLNDKKYYLKKKNWFLTQQIKK